MDSHIGIQGKDEDNAENVFKNHFIRPYKKLPLIWKPLSAQVSPAEIMVFESDGIMFGLNTRIDFATTKHRSAYDGYKLKRLHSDEPGKCFKIDEEVLMADGSIKKVQDVAVGDRVMGLDSAPRNVLSLARGKELMYDVIPNKGNSWGCNESHLLVLRANTDIMSKGFLKKKGEIVIITVKEYANLKGWIQRSLSLFRVGVDFGENEHYIPPYLLGVWLGDGSHHDTSIGTEDDEIKGYLLDVSEEMNLDLSLRENRGKFQVFGINGYNVVPVDKYDLDGNYICSYKSCTLAAKDVGVSKSSIKDCLSGRMKRCSGFIFKKAGDRGNQMLNELKRLNVFKNKHIPKEYLIDSRKNRLEILAGLIDTDGSLDKRNIGHKRNCYIYEITQKRKELAGQIQFLALSLGFYSSINSKTATMKREDGSMYSCEVYRVNIYGKTLHEIPCKVTRKNITRQGYTKNSKGRNPLHCGFKVEPVGVDNYYGFNTDGDRMFLLADFTVVHNCVGESVAKRHDVVKNCLSLGSGVDIIGFMQYTTTVDEMDRSSGENYLRLSKGSHYEMRNENGQTMSGLVNIFFRASDGLHGFIGKYGESVEDEPTWDQTKHTGKKIGARKYIENIRLQLLRDKNIEALIEHKRQHPMNWAEVFTPPAKNTFFRMDILENRIQQLQHEEEPPRRGNFYRVSADRDSDVRWVDDSDGKFYMSYAFKPEETNKRIKENGVYRPMNPDRFVASADPFRLEKTEGGKMSNGAIVVRLKHDPLVDPPEKEVSQWQTARAVITYNHRPDTKEEFAEDCLMACIYSGAPCYPENNIDVIEMHFKQRGYAGYLLYDLDWSTGRPKKSAGFFSGIDVKKKIFVLMRGEIANHGMRIKHIDVLKECMEVKGIDEMTDFDLFTAYGGSLLAEESSFRRFKEEPEIDTSSFLDQHTF